MLSLPCINHGGQLWRAGLQACNATRAEKIMTSEELDTIHHS